MVYFPFLTDKMIVKGDYRNWNAKKICHTLNRLEASQEDSNG